MATRTKVWGEFLFLVRKKIEQKICNSSNFKEFSFFLHKEEANGAQHFFVGRVTIQLQKNNIKSFFKGDLTKK